jgi:hypothetical protein
MVGISKARSASSPKSVANQKQSKAFIEAARELGCDEDPAHFDAILKKVARHKPVNHAAPNDVKGKGTKNPTK